MSKTSVDKASLRAARGPWEEIAKRDKFGKAVRTCVIEHKGKLVKADIVKPLHGDGIACYAGTGIAIRKAESKEIDGHTDWRTYQA